MARGRDMVGGCWYRGGVVGTINGMRFLALLEANDLRRRLRGCVVDGGCGIGRRELDPSTNITSS